MLLRTERHPIRKNNPNWKVCDDFCFKAKNLYNTCLYIILHAMMWKHDNRGDLKEKIADYADLVNDKGFIGKYDLIKRFTKLKHPDYYALSTQSSQQIVFDIYDALKATFALIKSKNVNHKVSFPRYKHKTRGRFTCTFTNQNTRLKGQDLFYSFRNKLKFEGIKIQHQDYQQVSIIPNIDGTYTLVITYRIEEVEKKQSGNTFGIDLGINNLMSISSDKVDFQPVLINGRPLKSMNRYWNKKKAKMQSQLPRGKKQRYISNAIYNLNRKRNNKVRDYLHKASRKVIDLAIKNNVYQIVIGYNKGWKDELNIGKVNNQKFTNIPFLQLIEMIRYKAEEQGIEVIIINESYTSKCSALDKEEICKHETYLGNRKTRGLFVTNKGLQVNADVNGSLNILRKVIGDDFIDLLDIGCVLQPKKLTIEKSERS